MDVRWRTSRQGYSRVDGHLLREPLGRLHWAGTETSTTSHGAIDGAILSGERAATEIMQRGQDVPPCGVSRGGPSFSWTRLGTA